VPPALEQEQLGATHLRERALYAAQASTFTTGHCERTSEDAHSAEWGGRSPHLGSARRSVGMHTGRRAGAGPHRRLTPSSSSAEGKERKGPQRGKVPPPVLSSAPQE